MAAQQATGDPYPYWITNQYATYYTPQSLMGWKCPECGMVHNPSTSVCLCSWHPKTDVEELTRPTPLQSHEMIWASED